MNGTPTRIRGTLSRICFHRDRFLIGCFDDDTTVKGTLLHPQIGLAYTLTGRWERHPRWGTQFAFTDYEAVYPTDQDAVRAYLREQCRWIGPKISQDLIATYGADTLRVCKDDPERVATQINGLTLPRAREIAALLRVHERDEAVHLALNKLLGGAKVSRRVVSRILATWGSEAPERIRQTPYALIDAVQGIGFVTADAVARTIGYEKTGAPRIRAGLVHALQEAMQAHGHTCLPRQQLLTVTQTLLDVPKERIDNVLAKLVEEGVLVAADAEDDDLVYLKKVHADERWIAFRLGVLLQGKPPAPAALDFTGLADDQQQALTCTTTHPVSLVTGSPGTGKCVAGNTICLTDHGMMWISELNPSEGPQVPDRFSPLDIGVCDLDATGRTSHFYYGGKQHTLHVRTKYGYELRGTPNHRVVCAASSGLVWKELAHLKAGDYVAIARGKSFFGSNIGLPSHHFTLDKRAVVHSLPSSLTTDLAYLMGLLTGDGSLGYRRSYDFCKGKDPDLAQAFVQIHTSLFGYKPKPVASPGRAISYRIASAQLRKYLRLCGLEEVKAAGKTMPLLIRRAPAIYVRAYLQGLFDTDGSADSRGNVQWSTASLTLAHEVQLALLNFGIIARRREKTVKRQTYQVLDLTGDAAREFFTTVGFRLARKQRRFWKLPQNSNTNVDVVPHAQASLQTLCSENAPLPRQIYRKYSRPLRGSCRPSRQRVAAILADVSPAPSPALTTLQTLAHPNVFWDRVSTVEKSLSEVYDLTVPDSHTFIANGFVNHNTTMIKRIVESFPDACVALAAPTGKAAKRLFEQTGQRAVTLHKLLEPQRVGKRFVFTRDLANPIEADLIVLDEVSMIDTALMARFVDAVADHTRLVLVGDPHQLPSVGPGNLLGELIASGVIPTSELTQIKRQEDGLIVRACQRLKSGQDPVFANTTAGDCFFLSRDSEEAIRATLLELVCTRLPASHQADPLRDIQVLTPVREKTTLSCQALNAALQQRLNPNPAVEGCRFRVGDKVIQTKNDYALGLMNGDLGRVDDIDRSGRTLTVTFEAPVRTVDLPLFDNRLELAYALTVHKAQGSEARVVVLPLHPAFGPRILQRNWLYTAVSRAQELCVLIGHRAELSKIVHRDGQQRRYTRLAQWMRSA